MPHVFPDAEAVMRRALELAARGLGRVEPNPPVGAVIVDDHLTRLGEGAHERFGGPHAEVAAIRDAGERARGASLFVMLEPCSHHGKTPPCTEAILAAGLRRVVFAAADPAEHGSARGADVLRHAGVEVEEGLLGREAERLIAPFAKRVRRSLPWVHAKWAMTLDGRIASRTGHSRWISHEASRERVHRLRARMDAILIGAGTARLDDPLLTARPPSRQPHEGGGPASRASGHRHPVRIVFDSDAALSLDSQLVRTAREVPVLVAATDAAPAEHIERLERSGVEVLRLPAEGAASPGPARRAVFSSGEATGESLPGRPDALALLRELGRREMTHVLIEGGGELLGTFFDRELIDELHVFIAPKLVGGRGAPAPLAGIGLSDIPVASQLDEPWIEILDGDIYVHGPLHNRFPC